jgi:hypothetical protein
VYETVLGDECLRLQNKYENITLRIFNWMSNNDLMAL